MALAVLPVEAIAEPDCNETAAPAPDEEGGWGPLFLVSQTGTLLPSVTIVPHGDSELWVDGRLFFGTEEPIRWTQGPYNALSGSVALQLPDGIPDTLAALRVRVVAKDPETGATRSVRQAARVYVYRVDTAVVILSEEAARSVVGLTMEPGEDGLIEDDLVGRTVTP